MAVDGAYRRSDLVRSAALGAAAAAQVLVPTLGPRLAGTREGADRYDTVITLPGPLAAAAAWGLATTAATRSRPPVVRAVAGLGGAAVAVSAVVRRRQL